MGNCCDGTTAGSGKEAIAPEARITGEELVRRLSSPDNGAQGGAQKNAKINLSAVQTVLIEAEMNSPESEEPVPEPARKGPRRVTGYVTKGDLEKAEVRLSVGSSDSEGGGDGEPEAGARRIKARKGTGYVTKEKLLEMLANDSDDDDDDDEGDEDGKLSAQADAAPEQPDKAVRCRNRKGTGYVTKDKLKKVLAAAGEDD